MNIAKKHSPTIVNILKKEIESIIRSKLITLYFDFRLKDISIDVERSKSAQHGDYCTNVAITLIKDPEVRMLFASSVAELLPFKIVKIAEVAPNGFINMFINEQCLDNAVKEVLKQKNKFGQFKKTSNFYNIEFVSANPTGLLHIGHARNAAIGDVLSRVCQCYGISINKEYYINDAGNQIDKLGLSLLIRYKQKLGKHDELPEDSYHGQEITWIAEKLITEIGNKYVDAKYDKDRITENKATSLFFANYAKNYLLTLIKEDLSRFGVTFDIWFSESSLYQEQSKLINGVISMLHDHVYPQDGAIWLKTSEFGDDKDRVLIKADNTLTYFTPDIVYHYIKLSRGYTKILNIWGSDHKSYVQRLIIALELLGFNKNRINVLITQMIRLTENGKEFVMSKRTGNSLTLRDLLETIGKDAARWYLVSQPLSSHIEIDVVKAKKQSNDNPIYYVQYAHARVNQLFKKALEVLHHLKKPRSFEQLVNQQELDLMNSILYFKHTIEMVATKYEVNKMTIFLFNLAKQFHAYYSNVKIIDENNYDLSMERLFLAKAIQQVIYNGLNLLGIVATEKM